MSRGNEIVDFSLDESDPDSIHMGHLHPDDGRALRYHFDEFLVGWIPDLAASLAEGIDLEAWDDYCGDGLLGLFIEQALYLELVQPARALFRRNFALRMGWTWNKPVRVVPELAKLVKAHLPGPVAETIISSPLLAGRSAISRFRRSLLPYRQAMWHQDRHHQQWQRPMIGVELVEGVDPSGKNDSFWMVKGYVDPTRVIFIVERHNLPLFDAFHSIQYAQSVGASVVTTDAALAYKLGLPYWEPQSALRQAQYPALPRTGGTGADFKARRWLFRSLREAGTRIQYWTHFFLDHNIAVYQHFTEASTETVLRRVAARRASAIEIGKMRSQFFEWNAAAFHFQHQIAMVWNANTVEVLVAAKTRTEYVVEIGYPYGYMRPKGDAARTGVEHSFAPNINVVCVVYDNHPYRDNHFTRQDLEAFYMAIISVAEHFSTLGLLVKSKKPMILDALPLVKTRLERLVGQGKCSIVIGKTESAAASAIHADIAVGVPCSTAACEAALLGCIVFIFDPSGARRFSETTAPGVVFRDIDEFKAHLENAVSHSIDTSAQESFCQLLAPASARSAHLRAANFLNAYLDAREEGKDGPASLNSAIQTCQEDVVEVC